MVVAGVIGITMPVEGVLPPRHAGMAVRMAVGSCLKRERPIQAHGPCTSLDVANAP